MEIRECIMGRRSIRRFNGKSIPEETLREIVEEASFSPSWKNTQIVRYVVVKDKELKEKISKCTTIWAGNEPIINSCDALVCVTVIKGRCGFERDGSYSTYRKDTWQMFDAGIASQTFCLSAHAHGIGSVILGLFDADSINELLNLPEDRELVALIPIGYPAETPVAPKRKSVDDLLTIL